MKYRIQAWFIALLLALCVMPAGAATFDVTARGRDEAVARTNAGVEAVRQTVRGLVTEAFLRTNRERVRKDVILQSGRFVRAVTVNSQQRQGTIVMVSATVDVDEQALAGTLAGMTLDETSRQRLCAALADPKNLTPTPPVPASPPASTALGAAPQMAAPQVAASAPSALVSDPVADGGASGRARADLPDEGRGDAGSRATAPDQPRAVGASRLAAFARDPVVQFQDTALKAEAANVPGTTGAWPAPPVRSNTGTGHAQAGGPANATRELDLLKAMEEGTGDVQAGIDVILEDTRTLLPRLVPQALLSVFLDADDKALADALLAVDIRELRLHGAVSGDDLDVSLLFMPPDPARMRKVLVEGSTLGEVMQALGLKDGEFPQSARPALLRKLEYVPGSPADLLRIQGKSIYLGSTGIHMIVGTHQSSVADAMAQLQQGVVPFAVEGTAPLRYRQCYSVLLNETAQPAQNAPDRLDMSVTTEMTPAPGGWILRSRYDLGGFWPELAQAGSLDLSDLLVCDKRPPFLLLGWANGKHMTALLDMLDENDPGVAFFRVLLEKLDSVFLSLGGSQVMAPPLRFPAITLAFRGDASVLQMLMAMGLLEGSGQDATVENWDSVILYALDKQAGWPLQLTLAQHDDILLGGLVDIQTLAQPRKDARAVLAAALEGSGLTLPDAVSSVGLLDCQLLWQELRALLDDTFIAFILEDQNSALRQALQQFLNATPPITRCVSWSESPDMTRGAGYIAVTDADTSPFYQALKNLIELLDKK